MKTYRDICGILSDTSNRKTRIVQGTETQSINEWPWQVSYINTSSKVLNCSWYNA